MRYVLISTEGRAAAVNANSISIKIKVGMNINEVSVKNCEKFRIPNTFDHCEGKDLLASPHNNPYPKFKCY